MNKEAERLLQKYPDRVPVIVNKGDGVDIPNLENKNFIVPKKITCGEFLYLLRKRMNLAPEKALFIFFNNQLVATHTVMSVVYDMYKNEDGILYGYYSTESTFG
jgi:GABA(A) receptor-associated protein